MSVRTRILITGGAGFVGSNLLRRLNELGETRIIVVDNLKNSEKYRNLVGSSFLDYISKEELPSLIETKALEDISVIFHQGACTDTLEYDGAYMMRNNYEYSKLLLNFCLRNGVPLIYASSAAVYGHARTQCSSSPEAPLNIYGYSKLLFDQYVRRVSPSVKGTLVGLRYFNVYGYGEHHKGRMSSMVHQFYHQLRETGRVRLFGAAGGYGPGEQKRDFVYVRDLVELNLYFWQRDPTRAILDAGTGAARTWNEVARSVIAALGRGSIEYIDFPASLKDKYQFFTQANVSSLRQLGYSKDLYSIEDGIRDYIEVMDGADEKFRSLSC